MDVFLTPQEVEARTGFKVETLRCWRRLGKGPDHIKVGTRVRYLEKAVTKWMNEGASQADLNATVCDPSQPCSE